MNIKKIIKYIESNDISIEVDERENLLIKGEKKFLTDQFMIDIKKCKYDVIKYIKVNSNYKNRENIFMASFSQKRFWILGKFYGTNSYYNIPIIFKLDDSLHLDSVKNTFKKIMERHEILRTTFRNIKDDLFQVIHSKFDFNIEYFNLSLVSNAENEKSRIIQDIINYDFNFENDFSFKVAYIHNNKSNDFLIVNIHHIAADHWSLEKLIYEFQEIYKSIIANVDDGLEILTHQYRDYVDWQRRNAESNFFQEQLSYWLGQLKGIPSMHSLPMDKIRPNYQTFSGKIHTLKLEEKATNSIKEFVKKNKITTFMFMHGVFSIAISRFSNEKDIVIGVPVNGRKNKLFEPLVGPFLNTCVLRLDFSKSFTKHEFFQYVKQVHLDAMKNNDIPFELLVDKISPERSISHSPIFQIMINMIPAGTFSSNTLNSITMVSEFINTKFDLTLNIFNNSSNIALNFEYNVDLFSRKFIESFSSAILNLIENITSNSSKNIHKLSMLSKREIYKYFVAQESFESFCQNESLLDFFTRSYEKYPNAIAFKSDTEEITYQEVESRSSKIANYMIKSKIISKPYIGICLDPSADSFLLILAALKSKVIYIPINPELPKLRIEDIVRDGDLSVVFCNSKTKSAFDKMNIKIIIVDSKDYTSLVDSQASHIVNRDTSYNKRIAGYIMYTSGTTGKPKGVVVRVDAMENFIRSMLIRTEVPPNIKWLVLTPISFDISFWEWYGCLATGGICLIVNQKTQNNIELLLDFIEQQRPMLIQATPSRWKQFMNLGWRGYDGLTIFCGGELLTLELKYYLIQQSNFVWNCYGPTEATVWSLVNRVVPSEGGIFIANSLRNYAHYVLDDHLNVVPYGAIGNLYIGGNSLAYEYLNKPNLTKSKFKYIKILGKDKVRVYDTGDLVVNRGRDKFDFVGRVDQQIKINGHRIEIEEIQRNICNIDGVKNAVVINNNTLGDGVHLTAFLIMQELIINTDEEKESIGTVVHELKKKIPAIMIPKLYKILREFPINENGKIDKNALMAIKCFGRKSEYFPPLTRLQKSLAELWKDILLVDRVGITDNFFDLGGDSLGLVTLANAIQKLGFNVSIRDLLQNQTIKEFSENMNGFSTESKFGVVVRLNNSKKKDVRLFLVHSITGTVNTARALAKELEDTCTVYGIQAPYLENYSFEFSSKDELAKLYFEEMRKIQPEPPYYIGGISSGGKIAYLMAQMAQEQNLRVEKYFSLDSAPPGFKDEPITEISKAIEEIASILSIGTDITNKIIKNNLDDDSEKISCLCDEINSSRLSNYFDYIDVDLFVRFLINFLKVKYEFSLPPFKGSICHFSTNENVYKEEINFQWNHVSVDEFEICDIDGNHYTFTNTNVFEKLILQLKQRIDPAQYLRTQS